MYDTKYATTVWNPSILKDFNVGSNPTVSAISETRVNTGKIEKASIYAGFSVSYMFSKIANMIHRIAKIRKEYATKYDTKSGDAIFLGKVSIEFDLLGTFPIGKG